MQTFFAIGEGGKEVSFQSTQINDVILRRQGKTALVKKFGATSRLLALLNENKIELWVKGV